MTEYDSKEITAYLHSYADLLLITSTPGSMINGFFDTSLPLLIGHGKQETYTLKRVLENAKKIPNEIMPETGRKALSILEEAVKIAERLDAEHLAKINARNNQ